MAIRRKFLEVYIDIANSFRKLAGIDIEELISLKQSTAISYKEKIYILFKDISTSLKTIALNGIAAGNITKTSQLINDGEGILDSNGDPYEFITRDNQITVNQVSDPSSSNPLSNEQIVNLINAATPSPDYNAPTGDLTNITQTVERGSDISNLNINITYNQRNGGTATLFELLQDGVVVATGQNNQIDLTNITSNIEFRGRITYNQGDCINNIAGNLDCRGRIAAGTVLTETRTIVQRLKIFYATVVNGVIINDTAGVRALQQESWDNVNSITLVTGTVNTKFTVFVPKSINNSATLSGQDVTFNASVTYTFVKEVSVTVGQEQIVYRQYSLIAGSPYGASANHVIDI